MKFWEIIYHVQRLEKKGELDVYSCIGTARPAWSAQRGTQKQLGLGKRAQDVTRGVDGRRTVFVTGEDRFLGRDRSQLAPQAGELYSSMILITS